WVRSLCSTLLGPAFSSDYAGDGPTSPLETVASETRSEPTKSCWQLGDASSVRRLTRWAENSF
ncbi:unnamed protein product, partial [Pylaiella littoralis]